MILILEMLQINLVTSMNSKNFWVQEDLVRLFRQRTSKEKVWLSK